MVFFGLLLIVIGVAVGLVSFFSLGYDSDGGRDREVAILANNNTTPELVFLLGVGVGAVVLLGLWSMKFGTQRGFARRKEHKRLEELSEKLEATERREKDGPGAE